MGRFSRVDSIPVLCYAHLIGLYHAFRGVSREKATGLAAVAGGVTELLATFGLAVTLVFEVVAIILLLRSSSGARPARAILSALSICCSGFMLVIIGLFLWLNAFVHRQ